MKVSLSVIVGSVGNDLLGDKLSRRFLNFELLCAQYAHNPSTSPLANAIHIDMLVQKSAQPAQ